MVVGQGIVFVLQYKLQEDRIARPPHAPLGIHKALDALFCLDSVDIEYRGGERRSIINAQITILVLATRHEEEGIFVELDVQIPVGIGFVFIDDFALVVVKLQPHGPRRLGRVQIANEDVEGAIFGLLDDNA